jgi:hypothetical protein
MRTLQYLRLRHGWSLSRMGRLLKVQPETADRLEAGCINCPEIIEHLEPTLQALFGEQWTWAKLMAPATDLTVPPEMEYRASA